MFKKFAGLIFLLSLLLPSMVWSQGNPRPYGAYTFDTGAWSPATSTYTDQALWYDPTPVALYCLNTTTNQWVPATSACFGGGGGTTTYALTAAATGGAAPGSTFNGSAAVTFDYHSFGAQAALTNPVTGPGSGATVGHVASMNNVSGDVIADSGVVAANLVVASSPGAGVAHFAGSTQTVTSAAVSLTADVSGTLPAANGGTGTTVGVAPVPVPTPSASITLAAPSGIAVCTGTCTVSVPVPAAGYQFCILNDDNVGTAITLSALGSSARYENSARTAYGTAGTGTLVLSAATGNLVCIVGRDSTHYFTTNYVGVVTVN